MLDSVALILVVDYYHRYWLDELLVFCDLYSIHTMYMYDLYIVCILWYYKYRKYKRGMRDEDTYVFSNQRWCWENNIGF